MSIEHDLPEFERRLERLEKLLNENLPAIAAEIDAIITGTATSVFMRDAGPGAGPRRPEDNGPLRIVSGTLARAVIGSFGAGGTFGERKSRVRLAVENARIVYEKIIEVTYAAIHENGGTVRVRITDRSRSYFWRKWYETGEEKWKRMALTPRQSFVITIPARPYLGPAVEHTRNDTLKIARDEVGKLVRAAFR